MERTAQWIVLWLGALWLLGTLRSLQMSSFVWRVAIGWPAHSGAGVLEIGNKSTEQLRTVEIF
jgi:hypothetical protein